MFGYIIQRNLIRLLPQNVYHAREHGVLGVEFEGITPKGRFTGLQFYHNYKTIYAFVL